VSLDEILVIFFGLLAVVLVEFSPKIFLNLLSVFSSAVGEGFQYISEGTGGCRLPVG